MYVYGDYSSKVVWDLHVQTDSVIVVWSFNTEDACQWGADRAESDGEEVDLNDVTVGLAELIWGALIWGVLTKEVVLNDVIVGLAELLSDALIWGVSTELVMDSCELRDPWRWRPIFKM